MQLALATLLALAVLGQQAGLAGGGLGDADLGQGEVDIGLQITVPQGEQHLAGLHRIATTHRQEGDAPAHRRGQLGAAAGLDRAGPGIGDGGLDQADLGFGHGYLDRRFAAEMAVCEKSAAQHHDKQEQQQAFHHSPSPIPAIPTASLRKKPLSPSWP